MNCKVGIVIEKDDYGYYAFCPELEGYQTQGDSLEEVMANIKEAIELYCETSSQDEKNVHLIAHNLFACGFGTGAASNSAFV